MFNARITILSAMTSARIKSYERRRLLSSIAVGYFVKFWEAASSDDEFSLFLPDSVIFTV